MRFITFAAEQQAYPVIILTKTLRKQELQNFVQGIEKDVVAYQLPLTKTPKKEEILEYVKGLAPIIITLRTDYLLVTDAAYFKTLTKTVKISAMGGYVLPCVVPGLQHVFVVYMPAPLQVLRDPTMISKVNQGLSALVAHRAGTYMPPGVSIIHSAHFPDTTGEIQGWLDRLIELPLAIDIETYSLKHHSAGIATITLCWSQHEGVAFCVDKDNSASKAKEIRFMLGEWFTKRNAQTLYHRSWFDVYVLTYQLFMDHLLDREGMLNGLSHLLRQADDTLLIRYLATNSCAGNNLRLKDAAQEFAGNYAVDVKDCRAVPKDLLLNYNLIDGLATWYVYNKHYPEMVADQQLPIYEEHFKPWLMDIIQMQLTGLPVNMAAVKHGKSIMESDRNNALHVIMNTPEVVQIDKTIADTWATQRNLELKVKRVTAADCKDTFNINSGPQLQILLHEIMKLPILETTDTGQPATGMDAIEALKFHTTTLAQSALLQAIIEYKQVEKLLTSFIPAFEQAALASDGHHYLYGSYNIGGTISGRLSSSDPNMQNLPSSGTKYAALIKKMFSAPKGMLFVGLDFNSLEDMISALTTKDPNKLKVYTDGYDGHSLRAFSYFGDQMTGIVETPASINSIQKLYKGLRQDSKAPTFALTYQGTWRTLVSNCGFSEQMAQEIEKRYHDLYAVSDAWVQAKLTQAAKDGYVTLAFGLRLRTPMLAQTIANTRSTPYEAVAEGRSAGNALGQSYCMLNSRAANEFMQRVRNSKYRYMIFPCAQIHDAQYYLIVDDPELLLWLNKNLVECVKWQQLPEIQHPTVKLGGELSVFHPSWASELTIPNDVNLPTLFQLAKEHIKK